MGKLVVAAALVDDLSRPTRLLAARRTAPVELRGQWELAGGKVDPGESEVAALRRELLEELGIKVQVGVPVPGPHGGRWPLRAGSEMVVYRATIAQGKPQPLQDHDSLTWVDKDNALTLPWLETNRPIIELLTGVMSKDRIDS